MLKEQQSSIVEYPQLSDEASSIALGLIESLHPAGYTIQEWQPEMMADIHQILEKPNWAPWLEASLESMSGRLNVFPEGQLVILDQQNNPLASLSMNQINWDGNLDTLPNWDSIAGDPTDYAQTYDAQGNTLVLMSMNVKPDQQGKRLPEKLVLQAQLLASSLGIEYLIGSFRPNNFGQAKKEQLHNLDFWEYATQSKVAKVDTEGVFGDPGEIVLLPSDGWLRSLTWLGMEPIKEDETAMSVEVPLGEFYNYQQSFHPESWWQDDKGLWHCSEVGCWKINQAANTATYIESNLFGSLPTL